MKLSKTISVLALVAATALPAAAFQGSKNTTRQRSLEHKSKDNGRANRFKGMDTNGDGMISRSEWRGNDQSFQRLDRNGDNMITTDEVRTARKNKNR